MNDDQVESLIELWLEGSLDSSGEASLNAWLQGNPQHMRLFVEANIREQMMRELDGNAFQDSEMPPVVSKAEPQVKSSRRTQSSWRNWRGIIVPLSLTACLLVLASGFRWFQNNAEPSIEPFLSIAAVQDVDADFRAGDRLADQAIQIEHGSLRLLFDDGVEVTLQGPAHYEMIALGKTRLLKGLLTATVPPGAEGFQVATPTADVVDLGTAFGIELSDDGAAKVSVFDGGVEVTPTRSSTPQVQTVSRATEGQAVLVSAKSEVELSELDATAFENMWPIASGIAESTGAFEFAPPWPRPMGLVQSDSKIFVLPEGYAQTVETPIAVNITDAGTYKKFSQLTDTTIAAGTRVKSFLLQFRPVDRDDGGRRAKPKRPASALLKRIVGEITFDQPVIGIVVRGDDLRATDRMFSKRGGQVPQKGRALELFGSPRDDVITFSEDRRTIKLDLAAFAIFSDQVRVIVGQSLQTSR